MTARLALALLPLLVPPAAGTAAPAVKTIVICAPGYPGDTAAAQPLMDRFASAASVSCGLAAGSLRAVYDENEESGLRRLAQPDSALALVPLPFFLQNAGALGLRAQLQVVRESGADEAWSLVARRGAVASPAGLAGWEVTGMPGYAPAFVRGPVLGGWGELPESARITFTASVLAALRRAVGGEKTAVVLDAAQSSALGSLPFAAEIEILTRSRPLPGNLLCTVGDRLDAGTTAAIRRGLLRLHKDANGAEVLAAMRMKRFGPVDEEALERARREFETHRGTSPR